MNGLVHRHPLSLAIGLIVIRARIPFPNEIEAWRRIQHFNAAPFAIYLQEGLI